MILDTSFLIALDADDGAARTLAGDLEARDVPLRVPTMVIQELYVAVGLGSESVRNDRKFRALVGNKPIVSLNSTIARRAGVLEGEHLASDAKPALGPADAVVAASAIQFDEPVVTTDGTDFERVDGLDVVSPAD